MNGDKDINAVYDSCEYTSGYFDGKEIGRYFFPVFSLCGVSLSALRVWPEVVHRWANTVGQRIRNDAVHGIVCAVPGLSVSAALPVYGAFRFFAVHG